MEPRDIKVSFARTAAGMAFLNIVEPLFEHWPTILIASSISFIYFYVIVPNRTLKAIYPKGPTPLPFIRHMWDTIRHKGLIHLQLDEYHKRYGDIYSRFLFGNMSSIVIADVDMLRDLFVKDFASFADHPVSSLHDF